MDQNVKASACATFKEVFDLKLGTVFIECLIPTLQIDREVVRPHIPKLLEALLICFNDDSWPVRDGRLSLEFHSS